jgi:hypothetical protein
MYYLKLLNFYNNGSPLVGHRLLGGHRVSPGAPQIYTASQLVSVLQPTPQFLVALFL